MRTTGYSSLPLYALLGLVGAGLLALDLTTSTAVGAAYVAIVVVARGMGARPRELWFAGGLACALILVGLAGEPAGPTLAALCAAALGLVVTSMATACSLRGCHAAATQLPYAELYAEIVDSSRNASLVVDKDLRVVSLNRTYMEWFRPQASRCDLLLQPFTAIDRGRWDLPGLVTSMRALLAREQDTRAALDFEVGQDLPRQGVRTLNLTVRKVSHLGEGLCLLVTCEDVTERKESLRELRRSHSNLRRTTAKLEETKERLAQAERLEAIGRLAGGVAHDYNNMLSAILGFSDLASSRLPADHPVQAFLGTIREAGQQSAALTRQLLAFGRKSILSPKVVDLNETLHSANKLLERLIGEDIRIEFEPGTKLGPVYVDPVQMEQAVVNLALNARDAMPQGGLLHLRTSNVHLRDNEAKAIEAELTGGNYVLLEVRDTGTGMDEEVLAHIFEPFFTTKDPAHGTGLGLASIHGFVKQSGGAICAESELGQGSVFRLYLPHVSFPAATRPSETAAAPRLRGTETILVVEDEAVVRGVMLEALGSHGYQVLLAADAYEGLRLCEDYPDTIDMIITDVVMPGMNGKEFIANLPPKRKGARVLYTSGYTETRVLSHGIDGEQVMFMPKPINVTDLLSLVREILDGSLTPSSP
ncbi:MAG: response regulator [Planctomycetota bacterium]